MSAIADIDAVLAAVPRQRRSLRVARQILPGTDTPITSSILVGLILTTLVLHLGSGHSVAVLHWASTNLANLRGHPVAALLASIFVSPGVDSGVGVVLALTGPALERRAGPLRALTVLMLGQVVATLASEGGLREAIWVRASAPARAFQLDLGASYVAFAAWGALLRYVPRRWRLPYLFLLATCMIAPLAVAPDMAGWGHLAAAGIGVLSWHWLPDAPPRLPLPRPTRLRLPAGTFAGASRIASATVVAVLAIGGVVTLYSGAQLVPLS